MAKEPDERYFSAGDFVRDAAAALRGMRDMAPPTIVATGEATLVVAAADDATKLEPVDDATDLALPQAYRESTPPATTEPEPPRETVPPATTEPEPPRETMPPAASEQGGSEVIPPAGIAAAAAATGSEQARPSSPPSSHQAPPSSPPGSQQAPPSNPPSSQHAPPTPPPPTSGTGGDSGPSEPPKKRSRLPIFAGVALIVVAAIVVIVVVSSGGSSTPPGQPFAAAAKPVPTNRVTGDGSATLHLKGDVASVAVDTNGLLNGQPHAMHIHAGGKGICPPASAARLHNGNRAISTTNGIAYYGPPRVSLTTSGDTSVRSIVDFSRYPRVGDVRYTRSVIVPTGVAAAIRAGDAVIVVHGIDYDRNGIYDNILDRSELSSSLPGEATAPALCGRLVSTKNASVSGGTTYSVAFHRTVVAAVAQGSSFALLCHLIGADTTAITDRRVAGTTAT